ncbi:MAG: 30S ribosomal protein S19e [Euryarchaeota archaeon]|nr:30S ribosomal protein S19e [Euryarchaeota archaeon]
MATVYDVPASELIRELSAELKKMKEISPPEWAAFVKTGANRERAPTQKDWWYTRAASVLRKVHVHGPVGIQTLRRWYGGRKNCGCAPDAVRRGSGSVIRNILKQLESAGLVEKTEQGRRTTPKARSLLDRTAAKIVRRMPELQRYR